MPEKNPKDYMNFQINEKSAQKYCRSDHPSSSVLSFLIVNWNLYLHHCTELQINRKLDLMRKKTVNYHSTTYSRGFLLPLHFLPLQSPAVKQLWLSDTTDLHFGKNELSKAGPSFSINYLGILFKSGLVLLLYMQIL